MQVSPPMVNVRNEIKEFIDPRLERILFLSSGMNSELLASVNFFLFVFQYREDFDCDLSSFSRSITMEQILNTLKVITFLKIK
jgi:hypothetical protein